ncbi:MAG TPA: class I SAM-dependent methyltransferase [Gammaproteobacteria bacterium]|nr:class I SAM-dependent methyltransferase [Gammaproteobacteria bacterium]
MKCRHCQGDDGVSFADLGSSPPSNAYLHKQDLQAVEKWYPLKVFACSSCWLVQTEDYASREEIFAADYAYFSSYSSTWLKHCEHYVENMLRRFQLGPQSQVGEVASNDGYLLQYFQAKGIPCYGIEPTESTAKAAREKKIQVFGEFFGRAFAQKHQKSGYAADLLIANNVLAHVPDINDFISGFTELLKPQGAATFEFHYLSRLVQENQFDTLYHEHYSYLSLNAVKRICERNGLTVFDVEELPTHGGSLRVYAQRADTGQRPATPGLQRLLDQEQQQGLQTKTFYENFQTKITAVKQQFLSFLLNAAARQEKVVAYGAAAKGNTLLNFAGVRPDLLAYVVDRNPSKQGRYLPGSRIPILSEENLKRDKPQWIVILPWNLREEIATQLAYAREWGAQFVTAIPSLTYF